MSSYSSFLTNSNNLNNNPTHSPFSKLTPTKFKPKTAPTTDPHIPQPERPSTQNSSPRRLPGTPNKVNKFTPAPFVKNQVVDNAKLYNSGHHHIPKYNPEKGPVIRVIPQHLSSSPTMAKQPKIRKGSGNDIILNPTLSTSIENKQGGKEKNIQKERRGSCNNLFMAGINKKPRMSMIEEPKTSLEQINQKNINKKPKGWTQNTGFHMQQSQEDQETNSSDFVRMPRRQFFHTKEFVPVQPKQRKLSDNECTRKHQVPTFLGQKGIFRRYSLTPHKKWSIDHFKIIRQLGKGAYGQVVLAQEKQSGFVCAIKILSKKDLQQQNMIEQFARQIKIQMYLRHPNIIKVYGFFDDLLHLYILMQCAIDKRLSDVVQSRQLAQPQASAVFYQLCSAMNILHIQSVIHRDLKPENVMFHEGVIKLCDFGWSVYRGSQLRTTFCGTPLYLCPEILVGDSYDESVDVWALGIILYQMVIGGNPFAIKEAKDLVNIIHDSLNLYGAEDLSPEVKEIITACLRKKGEDRPSIKWLMAREWVRKGRPEEFSRLAMGQK